MSKSNKIIAIGALIIVLGVAAFVFFPRESEEPEEVIEEEPIREQIIEDILERLTPEGSKLTDEEEEKILEQLTPPSRGPMTEEEKRQEEEILKQLTP